MPKDKEEKVEEKDIQVAAAADAEEVTVEEPTLDETTASAVENVALEESTITDDVENQSAPIEGDEDLSTPDIELSGDSGDAVTVQSVKFASFEDLSQTQGEINKNLEILMDIKLQMTVELGRTELPIKKVLELTRGSIIELEKVAGEPVELYANGKLVAHGEVVVIEDNFGLRITSITEPEDRLKGIS